MTISLAFSSALTAAATADSLTAIRPGVMTVPNIDFRSGDGIAAAGSASQTGCAPAQRVAAGAGMTLVLLQDERITPAIREAMEPSGGDPDQAFADNLRLQAEFNACPLRNGLNQAGTAARSTRTDVPVRGEL